MQTPRTLCPQLSGKQLRWIDEYLVDMNGAAAAVRAGYSERSARAIASENLTKPALQAVLLEKQAAMASDLQITRQNVIQGFLEAVDMSRQQQNPAAMVGALREVAKILGLNAPEVRRVEVAATNPAYEKLITLSDAQLLDLMAAGPRTTTKERAITAL